MKGLSVFNKFVFTLNILALVMLLVACAVPHIQSAYFSFLSFLSLGVPVLVLSNALFFLYWAIQRKKQAYASLFILVLGYFALGTFVKFNFGEATIDSEDLKVMSYNVRMFNTYGELKSKTVFEDIKAFIEENDPDIICFQEPDHEKRKEFTRYPHRYLEYIHMQGKGLLGIFSKHPILKTGLVHFPRTTSNGAFADILYKNDTIRIYNTHLESLGITPGNGVLRKEPSEKLFHKLNGSFKKQQEQVKILRRHLEQTKYRTILCGDFNNSQFSNVYNSIKGELQDTFVEEGSGYGRTLNFHGIPVRIDFILVDDSFEVKSHTAYDVEYSDHFPIMASFELRGD